MAMLCWRAGNGLVGLPSVWSLAIPPYVKREGGNKMQDGENTHSRIQNMLDKNEIQSEFICSKKMQSILYKEKIAEEKNIE